MNNFTFSRSKDQTDLDFIYEVCAGKDSNPEMTWVDVKEILNDVLDLNYSDSWYRKNYRNDSFPEFLTHRLIEDTVKNVESNSVEEDKLFELRKERVKLSDERSQMMAAVRRIAREETLLEIAKQVAETLKDKPVLPNYSYVKIGGTNSAILEISDWHYGIEVNNPWNIYNPEIAKDRIIKLRDRVVELIQANKVKELYVANLGDLISGRMHDTIRIQNRIDVISQSLEVAEILVEFLAYLSQYVNIKYISTSDNHSRLEPKKDSSLDLESLTRVIQALLEARIDALQARKKCNNIEFIRSPYGPDIATFNIKNYKVGAVHGHKDSPKMIVNNISLMTRDNYDLILSAHLHHFSAEDNQNTMVISNGSLMGVDEYAESLRLVNKPSQNFIVVSDDSVVESIHRIVLE